MDSLTTAHNLLSTGGDVETFRVPTEKDVTSAQAHALIDIAESLRILVGRQ